MTTAIMATLVVLAGITAGATGQQPGDTARSFGTGERIEQISLSPDGRRVAVVVPRKGHGSTLIVLSNDWAANGTTKPLLETNGFPERLRGCQ